MLRDSSCHDIQQILKYSGFWKKRRRNSQGSLVMYLYPRDLEFPSSRCLVRFSLPYELCTHRVGGRKSPFFRLFKYSLEDNQGFLPCVLFSQWAKVNVLVSLSLPLRLPAGDIILRNRTFHKRERRRVREVL